MDKKNDGGGCLRSVFLENAKCNVRGTMRVKESITEFSATSMNVVCP